MALLVPCGLFGEQLLQGSFPRNGGCLCSKIKIFRGASALDDCSGAATFAHLVRWTSSSPPPPVRQPASDRDAETGRLLISQEVEGLRRLLHDHAARVLTLLVYDFAGQLDRPRLEEAIGEALFLAWRGSERYHPERGTVRAWLFAIARNRARKMVERLSRDEVEFVADLDETGAATRAAVGEALTMAKETLAAMRGCLEHLAPRQRDVLLADLANDGHASTQDLASQMNISRNAVYQARREGRLALRSALKRCGHELPPAVDGDGGNA